MPYMVRLWSSAAWAIDAAAMPASTAKLNTDFFTLDSPLGFVQSIRSLSDKAGLEKRVTMDSPRDSTGNSQSARLRSGRRLVKFPGNSMKQMFQFHDWVCARH